LVIGARGSYQVFTDDPNKIRIPDVSFTRRDRVPKSGPAEGHGWIAPDLVVEFNSPNDSGDYVESKIKDFLAAGVPLIWVAYPQTKTVLVHRNDGTANRLQVGDVLDGEDVLPGFRCEVAALFA
jgi:Uma2 family endonuclease